MNFLYHMVPKSFSLLSNHHLPGRKKKKLLNASTRHHLITPTQQKQKRVRRGGKNPQKNCTRKVFMTQITTMVWSLTQNQTSWSVKSSGALESITTNKASGGDEIPAKLFQVLKDDAVEVLHSICQQIWKTQQWPQDQKRSVFIPISKKGNAKECSNYRTIALISHASKVMLKISKPSFSRCEP